MEKSSKHGLVLEVFVVVVVLVLITSILNAFPTVPFLYRYKGVMFALLFLYVPVIVIHSRGRKIDFLDKSFASYSKSVLVFFVVSLIAFPLFLIAAHGWMKILYSAHGPVYQVMPDFWNFALYQLVMVSLPEEFFFRGYMQSSLNVVFARKWRILGVNLGWSWIITAAVFAVAHSIIMVRWWHFAIFFPALLFGYLREKTGSITAPVLFHGLANIIMNWVGYLYI